MEREEILKVKEEKERAETEKRKRAEDAFLKRIEEKREALMRLRRSLRTWIAQCRH